MAVCVVLRRVQALKLLMEKSGKDKIRAARGAYRDKKTFWASKWSFTSR